MRFRHTLLLLSSLFVLNSCSKKETVGLFTTTDLNNLSVEYIDTFTVKTSTVAMDSLPTFSSKNDNMILAGRYVDPLLGTVTAQPYFQVGLGGGNLDFTNQPGLSVDSLALVLYYNSAPALNVGNPNPSTQNTNNNYYTYTGDTTKLQTFSLYRINQDYQVFRLKNPSAQTGLALPYFYDGHGSFGAQVYTDIFGTHPGYLFNTSKQSYDATQPIASVSFYPKPRTVRSVPAPAQTNGTASKTSATQNDSIVFRLPDSMARAFLQAGLIKDVRFQQTKNGFQGQAASPDANFVNYLKGFTIVAGHSNTAVLSFDAAKSQLRFYYKTPGNGVTIQTFFKFPVTTTPTLFNSISTDRTGTALQGIKPFVAIPSEKTGNQSFVQAGSGLMTRIEFPYLYNFKISHPYLTVNRAELTVQTGYNSYFSQTPSIPWLTLYSTDRTNYPLTVLPVDFVPGSQQFSFDRTNTSVTQVGVYHYFVVQFAGYLLNKTYNDGTALLMGPAEKAMDNSVERVVLGNMYNNLYPIRLRLYYSKIANN